MTTTNHITYHLTVSSPQQVPAALAKIICSWCDSINQEMTSLRTTPAHRKTLSAELFALRRVKSLLDNTVIQTKTN